MSPGLQNQVNDSAQLVSWGCHAETALGMTQRAGVGICVLCLLGLLLFAPYHVWLPRCSAHKHTLAFECGS